MEFRSLDDDCRNDPFTFPIPEEGRRALGLPEQDDRGSLHDWLAEQGASSAMLIDDDKEDKDVDMATESSSQSSQSSESSLEDSSFLTGSLNNQTDGKASKASQSQIKTQETKQKSVPPLLPAVRKRTRSEDDNSNAVKTQGRSPKRLHVSFVSMVGKWVEFSNR